MRFATLAARPAPAPDADAPHLVGPLRPADLGPDPEAVAAAIGHLDAAAGGRAELVLDLPAGAAAEELVDAGLRLLAAEGREQPPLWLACGDEAAVRRAGSLGVGALVLAGAAPIDLDGIAGWVGTYRAALGGEGCVALGPQVITRVGLVAPAGGVPPVAGLRAAGVDLVALGPAVVADPAELRAAAATADADDAARERALADVVEAALARRAPLRSAPASVPVSAVAPPPYPTPPVASAPVAPAAPRGRPRARRLRRRALDRVEAAFAAAVRGADDARLERTVVSPLGLRVLFRAMERRFAPERAEGIRGELGFELRRSDGDPASWTLVVDAEGARARPGRATDPRLLVRCSAADLARIAAREVDAGDALLDGRLDVEGDFALAARLGRLLGPSG